jgi:hypothetical protein
MPVVHSMLQLFMFHSIRSLYCNSLERLLGYHRCLICFRHRLPTILTRLDGLDDQLAAGLGRPGHFLVRQKKTTLPANQSYRNSKN